jgi:hypothetical protein
MKTATGYGVAMPIFEGELEMKKITPSQRAIIKRFYWPPSDEEFIARMRELESGVVAMTVKELEVDLDAEYTAAHRCADLAAAVLRGADGRSFVRFVR